MASEYSTATDMSNMPPVPRNAYDTLLDLITTEQMPERRLAELLEDAAFNAWLQQQRQPSHAGG